MEEECPKCGRMYNCPPAKSREDGKPICPVCGVVEALEAASIPEEEQRAIIELAEKTENGRVKPLCKKDTDNRNK